MDEIESLVTRVTAERAAPAERLAAFGEIVRRFQDMAYGCAYAVLADFHLAEDAAQEAFVAAYRQLGALREPRAFAGWLRRLVLTQCHRITRRKRVPTTGLDAAAEAPAPDLVPPDVAEAREMAERVLAAVQALPEPQRMVTTLFYINGYSQDEIADFLEAPVSTVKKRLAASRRRLKQRMVDMVDETFRSFALPRDFTELVVRRAASPDDLKQAAALLSYANRTRPEQFASPEKAEQAGVYVVGREGRVDGAGFYAETDFGIGRTMLRAVRPNEMGGEGEGVPDPAFVTSSHACFKLARERGVHLAVVHGSQYDHAFCGFVPCFYHPYASVPCDRVRAVATRATVREARDDEEKAAGWRANMQDPYATKIGGYSPGAITHVVEQGNRPVGYVSWTGRFTNMTVETREAALAVLRFGLERAEQAGKDEIGVCESHMTLITQTMLSLGATYRLRRSCDIVALDNEMVAVLDAPALVAQLQGEFQARVSTSLARDADAALSIGMGDAIVSFVACGGRLEIGQREQRVHRALPRWAATRLLVGYYSGADLLAMGPIPWDRSDGRTPDDPDRDYTAIVLPEAEAALFAALFPKLWPCSSPDPDVLPWLVGAPHPQYRHGDNEPPERKARIAALRLPWIGF